MKQILLLGAAVCMLAAGCTHKDPADKMTVIRDCSGSYLRFGGKDYHVCNKEKTDVYPDGATVMASFKKIGSCPRLGDEIVCKLYHANEGWVEVTGIR